VEDDVLVDEVGADLNQSLGNWGQKSWMMNRWLIERPESEVSRLAIRLLPVRRLTKGEERLDD
jgi:hypothetical protein